jgi:CheY-like chemotaxis protein
VGNAGMLVLVVDDEVAIVELLAELLTDEGYDVHTAFDGRNALTLLRSGLRPMVIITDIMMPGLDGWGLYSAIRDELELREPGIVLMSAGRPDPRSAGRANPKHLPDARVTFVAKPFNVFDMLEAIARVS